MTAIIPDVFCQVTLIVNADSGRKLMGKHVRACGQPAVSPYGLCRQHDADRRRLQAPSQRPPNPDQ